MTYAQALILIKLLMLGASRDPDFRATYSDLELKQRRREYWLKNHNIDIGL